MRRRWLLSEGREAVGWLRSAATTHLQLRNHKRRVTSRNHPTDLRDFHELLHAHRKLRTKMRKSQLIESNEDSFNVIQNTRIEGIDLFCGVGGLSCGLAAKGIRVVAGIDVDPACQYPYEANHEGAIFLLRDVTTIRGAELNALWSRGAIRLLAGCAPCQPFSSYANTSTVDKAKWRLLMEFARLVDESRPDLVTMENVRRLQQAQPFKDFLRALKRGGYEVAYAVVNAADYGAPQQRKRLVLVASRLGPVALPEPTHKGREKIGRAHV